MTLNHMLSVAHLTYTLQKWMAILTLLK